MPARKPAPKRRHCKCGAPLLNEPHDIAAALTRALADSYLEGMRVRVQMAIASLEGTCAHCFVVPPMDLPNG